MDKKLFTEPQVEMLIFTSSVILTSQTEPEDDFVITPGEGWE